MNTVTPLAVGLLCLLQTACALDARTQESLTTGDKLRAIDAAPRDASTWTQPSDDPAQRARMQARLPEWCNDLRARLLSGAPSMYAELWNERPPQPTTPQGTTRPSAADDRGAVREPWSWPLPADRPRTRGSCAHPRCRAAQRRGVRRTIAPAHRASEATGVSSPIGNARSVRRWIRPERRAARQ